MNRYVDRNSITADDKAPMVNVLVERLHQNKNSNKQKAKKIKINKT